MLEENYLGQLAEQLANAQCDINVPPELQDALTERGVVEPVRDDLRRFVRHRFATEAVMELSPSLPQVPRPEQSFRVLTKDVSRNGVSFLHSQQLFPGETLVLWLQTGQFSCTVARCIRHNENCFEIGTMFSNQQPASI